MILFQLSTWDPQCGPQLPDPKTSVDYILLLVKMVFYECSFQLFVAYVICRKSLGLSTSSSAMAERSHEACVVFD